MDIKIFDAIAFFKENAGLFTVSNLFLFISLYVTSYINSSSTLNQNVKILGQGLIFVSAITVLFIFVYISSILWNGRKDDISTYFWFKNRIQIKQSDPYRLLIYILLVSAISFYLGFILYGFTLFFEDPLIAILVGLLILAVPSFIQAKFLRISIRSIDDLDQIEAETALMLQQYDNCVEDWFFVEGKEDVPLDIYELIFHNLLELWRTIQHLDGMYGKNRIYHHKNPQYDGKSLKDMLSICDRLIASVLRELAKNYMIHLNVKVNCDLEEMDHRSIKNLYNEIEEIGNKVQFFADAAQKIALRWGSEYPFLNHLSEKIAKDYISICKVKTSIEGTMTEAYLREHYFFGT